MRSAAKRESRGSVRVVGVRRRDGLAGAVFLYLVDRGLEVLHTDLRAVVTDGEHSGLGGDGGDVGTVVAVSTTSECLVVGAVGDVHVAGVDLEDLDTTLLVGFGHLDEAVEPAWPENRPIEHVEAVRRRDDSHLTAVLEAVHLRQQLHHRPLDLGVARGLRLRPLRGNRVYLVDKDDRRFALGGEFEQIADEPGTLTNELSDQLGAGHLDEGGVGLVGDRTGEHRLTGAGRTVQEDAGGRVDTGFLELLRVDEWLLDGLTDFFHLLLQPADIGVGDVGRLVDLHRLGTGVRLGGEGGLDGEGVVDSDAVAGLNPVSGPGRDLRKHLLVVAVLLDDGLSLAVVDLLDGGNVQRGRLQRLVLAFDAVDFLFQLAPTSVGGVELLGEFAVNIENIAVMILQSLQPLLLRHVRIQLKTRPVRQRGTP